MCFQVDVVRLDILLTSPTPAWKVSRQRLGATLWQFPLLPTPVQRE